MPHRADLQGLRAVAIVLVVLGHGGVPWLAGGYVGVDVFYVLSGYLITGLLLAEQRAGGTVHIAAFYVRRLRRLLPALLVMLAVTSVAAAWLLAPFEARALTRSAPYAATWTSNLYFAFRELDYFDATPDLFLHTWSLAVEEQFYLVWPLVLLVALRRAASLRRLMLVLVGLGAASLLLFAVLGDEEPLWAFYLMPARVWQFALGGLVATGLADRWLQRWRHGMAFCGLVGIVGSALLLRPEFPQYGLVVPSLGCALVIAAGRAHPAVGITRALAHPLGGWIGDRSYSWYLWHWPALQLALTLGADAVGTAVTLGISLALAALTYRWVELPFWKGRWRRTGSVRTAMLGGALAMSAATAAALRLPDAVPEPPPSPAVLAARAAREDHPAYYWDGCDTPRRSSILRPCVYGEPAAPRTVVMLGDSIGLQWQPMVAEALRPPVWRMVVLTKSACPIVEADPAQRVDPTCIQWRRDALQYLRAGSPADLIVVGTASSHHFTPEQWRDGSRRILDAVAPAARRVLVIAGNPGITFHGPRCLERAALARQRQSVPVVAPCDEPLARPRAAEVARILREVAAGVPGATVLDLHDAVCPGGHCSAARPDGTIVFRDYEHLTAAFVRGQAATLRAHLLEAGIIAPGP